MHYWVNATPEPNVWRLMTAPGDEGDYVNVMEAGETSGFALSYVDEFHCHGTQASGTSLFDQALLDLEVSSQSGGSSVVWR